MAHAALELSPAALPDLKLAGFTWTDLHDAQGLARLTAAFDQALEAEDLDLYARYDAHRKGAARLSGPAESELLVALAPCVSRFVGALFGARTQEAQQALRDGAGRDAPLFRVKRDFVQRRVFKKGAADRPTGFELTALEAQAQPLLALARQRAPGDPELQLALLIDTLLDAERALAPPFDPKKPGPLEARAFAAWRELATGLGHEELGQAEGARDLASVRAHLALLDRYAFALVQHEHRVRGWALFKLPRPIDQANLVPLRRPNPLRPEQLRGLEEHQRRRQGFGLTDLRMEAREARSEIDYCLYCHEREKDTCSRGFLEKQPASNHYKKNAAEIPLTGCPLEERISEAHLVAKEGDQVGALALITIDNPMTPGTGHRICNDCMKACIYQKQSPVDIPQIETRILSDVLGLPWGYEVWSLLTRWNPLKIGLGQRQHPRPYSGINVLVVGMGPAGYTVAHHLLNEGFGVIGIDGLKIEPLDPDLIARRRGIEEYDAQFGAALDERITSGFGGVSEYGITVRWDKSFLDVLHLNLARRTHFRLYGGTRFGGTITVDEAFEKYGFHHVALASGAGKPTIIGMKNNLIRGVRKASDFLMALQLTGAFKASALANLQVRLPALVIGGGLTAIDTATELAAYYPVQVAKLLSRHEKLTEKAGDAAVYSLLDLEEREVYQEQLEHGREVQRERARAAAEGEEPDFAKLVASWGGVTIAYRKGLNDSPAYRLNHEEVVKCLEEGIVFAEGMSPLEAVPDAHGAVQAVRFSLQRQEVAKGAATSPGPVAKWRDTGEVVELKARTVCVAAGTSPNITLEKEAPGAFALDPAHSSFKSFLAERDEHGVLQLVPAQVENDLSGKPGFFTSYLKGGRVVSYFGDNHPVYAGSVVKAMASAKDGYPQIAALFTEELLRVDAGLLPPKAQWASFVARLDDELIATVQEVKRLTPTIVEVIVRAKAAARGFKPGQFYRLQNFESLCAEVEGTKLLMEGLALTGAWVDRERGLLSLIVLEMGSSSRLCERLEPGEPVVVMGPTGAPSTIPRGEDVVLCGGGLGNAVLFSISRALRDNGCRVLYFAGYRHARDLFKRDEIEEATDVVIWSVDKGSDLPLPRRPQDRAFSGNMVEAMVAYATGALGEVSLPFSNVRRIIAIGSDRMMAAVTRARHHELRDLLPADHVGIASINSPMQCMMKEICAQCLQKHRDPKTGKETVLFTCFDQDQPMDSMDWENLRARLRMNSLHEKLSAIWLQRLLADQHLPRG